jgi:hypothetical protein
MGSGGFRANAPEIDVPAMERDLARIPAVSSARVVEDDGQVNEVHIVCGTGRSPKLIGRDVQSLLAARWGVDIDHRKVSVVQLEDGGGAAEVDLTEEVVSSPPPDEQPVAEGAPRLVRVAVVVSGDDAEATVSVAAGDREVAAQAKGVPSWVGQRRLAATAALEALGALDPAVGTCQLEDVTVIGNGAESIVVTSVSAWRDGVERTFAGAAPVGSGGELRAAAESVLRAFRS